MFSVSLIIHVIILTQKFLKGCIKIGVELFFQLLRKHILLEIRNNIFISK